MTGSKQFEIFDNFEDDDELINFPPNETALETYDNPRYARWSAILCDNLEGNEDEIFLR